MRESSSYQYILEEGRIAACRKMILRLGRKCLGPPDEAVETMVGSLSDLPRLERIVEQTVQVNSWQELLDTP